MSRKTIGVGAIVLALSGVIGIGLFLEGVESASARCIPNGTLITTTDGTVGEESISFEDTTLSDEQLENAKTIIGVGVARGFDQRDIAIAVAVAMQESNLVNVNYGDRDSLGLFQQRPSQGWGTASQVKDPVYAANKFYDALARVKNRDSLSMIEVGIKVQRPSRAAYESRWKWDDMATSLVQQATGNIAPPTLLAEGELTQAVSLGQEGCQAFSTSVTAAIQSALSQVGTPYKWGAEEEGEGFDCSGLIRYAYKQAGITLKGNSVALYDSGTKIEKDDLLPGDLVYWSSGSRGNGVVTHVAMYLGNDQIVEAPRPGTLVGVSPMRWNGYVGATRPVTEPEFVGTSLNGWQLPLQNNYRISSDFNPNRFHPILKIVRPHNGTDFGGSPIGTEVYAASAGTISEQQFDSGWGNYVLISHAGDIQTRYAHLSSFASGLGSGSKVQAGQLIGYVGNTGLSQSPHLHFEVLVDGRYVNPVTFLQERGINP